MNKILEQIKQSYSELLSICSIEDFPNEFLSEEQREVWMDVAYSILKKHDIFKKLKKDNLDSLYIELKLPESQRFFLTNTLLKNIFNLENKFYENIDNYRYENSKPKYLDLRPLGMPNKYFDSDKIKNFIVSHIPEDSFSRMSMQLSNLGDGTYKNDVTRVLTEKLFGFNPDLWLKNADKLKQIPTSFKNKSKCIPVKSQDRLEEIYRAYIYGHWFSVIILSRAVLENSIIFCRNKFSIQSNRSGKYSLDSMISDISESIPKLEKRLKIIQDYGNYIVHPVKDKKINVLYPKLEIMAEESLKSLVLCLDAIYSFEQKG